MGDVVDIKPVPIEDDELVEDLARFADGTLSEAQVKARHRLNKEQWLAMGESDELVRLVEAAKLRRIRTGATKREKAQLLVVAAPDVLSGILLDNTASPRHRIDSAKELNAFASNGAEVAAAGARFEITINLGSDVERYSKSIAIDVNDVDPHETDRPKNIIVDDTDPNEIDVVSQDVIAAITMNKSKGGGSGQGHI